MKTTARQATAVIAGATLVLAAVVIAALLEHYEDHEHCELCDQPAADLYDRLTEDCDEVRACERCIAKHHLGYVAD
jgi:hypothetical protein